MGHIFQTDNYLVDIYKAYSASGPVTFTLLLQLTITAAHCKGKAPKVPASIQLLMWKVAGQSLIPGYHNISSS